MIPAASGLLNNDYEIIKQPSKNYQMHMEQEYISGYCDKQEAMQQTIFKILSTERYQYIMYSWNYGIKTIDLYGEPVTYACAELQRRITEALVWDDRINSCEGFTFDVSKKGVIHVKFTAHTIFGDVPTEKAVNV